MRKNNITIKSIAGLLTLYCITISVFLIAVYEYKYLSKAIYCCTRYDGFVHSLIYLNTSNQTSIGGNVSLFDSNGTFIKNISLYTLSPLDVNTTIDVYEHRRSRFPLETVECNYQPSETNSSRRLGLPNLLAYLEQESHFSKAEFSLKPILNNCKTVSVPLVLIPTLLIGLYLLIHNYHATHKLIQDFRNFKHSSGTSTKKTR